MDKTTLKIGTVTYADNTTQTLQLPRGRIYRELVLWLQGAPTVTAVNNVPANLGKMEAWSLLSDIQLIVNGSQTIRRFSGEQLAMLNYFYSGVIPKRENTFGDGQTANPSFSRALRIPMWMPFSSQPFRTMLDARRLVSLDLRVTFKNWTAINTQASAWTTTPTLTVYQEYVLPEDPLQVVGPFDTWQQNWSTINYSAAVNNNQIKLPLGMRARGFMFNTTNASSVDTTGLMTVMRWKSGAESFVEIDEEILREMFRYQRGLAIDPVGTISASTAFNKDAWYFYDRMNSGSFSDSLDTYGFVDNNLYVDYSGSGNLNYMMEEIVPVRRSVPRGIYVKGKRTTFDGNLTVGP